jgi:hypothetical protein
MIEDRALEKLQERRQDLLERERKSHEHLRNLQTARMREIERIEYRFSHDMKRIELELEKVQHDLRNLDRDIDRRSKSATSINTDRPDLHLHHLI